MATGEERNDDSEGWLRNYLKTAWVGRELPFDKLRANVFLMYLCGENSRK